MFVKKGKFKARIVFWRRIKANSFFFWKLTKNTTQEDFKTYLNSIEPGVHFTLEMEKNRALNFTDLTIISQDNRLVIKVYRKETHRNRCINWKSNVPKAMKIGSIKTLIFRASALFTLPGDRENELNFLSDAFISNGYPIEVVNKVISRYIPQKHRTRNEEIKPIAKKQIIFENA